MSFKFQKNVIRKNVIQKNVIRKNVIRKNVIRKNVLRKNVIRKNVILISKERYSINRPRPRETAHNKVNWKILVFAKLKVKVNFIQFVLFILFVFVSKKETHFRLSEQPYCLEWFKRNYFCYSQVCNLASYIYFKTI